MRFASEDRRDFLKTGAAAGAGLFISAAAMALPTEKEKAQESAPPEVAPAEDLMREHGVLNRVLLIYEESLRRLEPGQQLPRGVLPSAAKLIRRFIENYHERLEEDGLFPRFEKAGKLTDLVSILRRQHQAGRRLTSRIERLAAPANASDRQRLAESLRSFIRMYRPHEAREDTVLFPALHEIVSAREYEELGDRFEAREQQLFGANGFERIVGEVAELEKQLGVYDLAKFTPK